MHYPLKDRDDESEKDLYSQVPMKTERPRKQQAQRQPIHFGFDNNNEYTINTETPKFHESQKINSTVENVNKLLENMENRFKRMSENLQTKHETQLIEAFEQIQQTIIEFNTQQNQRTGFNDPHMRSTQVPEFRPQRSETQNNDTQNNSVTEPPLPFYKQSTSMSINEELQPEILSSNGSVPTTIKPFDGTVPGYTVEEYLTSIIAALIFSDRIEPVNRPGHHQWKIKRAALIIHTLQGPAQKWYSTLPSETKLDWELFCKEVSDMFDSEISKQRAKTVLKQIQKHTNEFLRSLALRIETLVKTAYTLYTEDYKNSVMNQTFIRCLDNELITST